jgi:hypothetical protein
LPFEEPPVAADQKKKGLPSEFYVLRLKQLHAPAPGIEAQHGTRLYAFEIGHQESYWFRPGVTPLL